MTMAGRKNYRVTADIVPMVLEEESDDDSDIPNVPNLRKNLNGVFLRPSILEPPVPHEHMKVFLRIRPFSKDELERNEDQQCFTVETDKTLITHPPKESHFYKNMTRGTCKTTTQYTFSHIYNENTLQKDFFRSTMLGMVKDFIDGQNCLVFTYGVTSSGKTYTIQGNPKDAGILPRALDVLFNSINKRQWDGLDLKPKMFVDVTRLTPEQELIERKVKERVMKLSNEDDVDVMSLLGDDASDRSTATNTTACSEASNISTMDTKDSIDSSETMFKELETRVREEGKVSVDEQGQVKFSVWVSFAEIYNEQIYDLLEPVPKKKKNYRRPCLKLSEDKNGSPYIKGLKYIHVSSADEAYKLLTIGQRNLQTACTKLNQNSSRSHCIFNIKVLRVMDKDNPHVARVSMLTLCDLAGSERYGKTQTSGERLKEAGNINTSLLTLGRCIETLRHNQTHKEQTRIIPFRESKLTRLFQNFFVGRGKAAMIVNVNQLASMFDETMHVFKFSAIASKVEVQQKPIFIKPRLPVPPSPAKIPRTSIMWATPARNANLKQSEAENCPLPEDTDDDLEEEDEEESFEGRVYTQENIDELLVVIQHLQTDLENEIHSKYKMEKMIRQEVCDEMMKQFAEIEESYCERIKLREQRAEELAEKRMEIALAAERAKRRDVMTDKDDEWVSSVLLHQEKVKVEKQEAIIAELKDEIEQLRSKVQDEVSEKVASYEETIKSLEDSLSKERDNAGRVQELLKQVTDHESTIKSLEENIAKKRENDNTVEDLKKQLTDSEDKIKLLQEELSKRGDVEESGTADLVENLTQQLKQAREHIKEQETEIGELNEMLTEAGETFEQKQEEISKLKELNKEYEKRMEAQAEAVRVLERAASDSKVAMETADQSLSKREECVAKLQAEIRELEGEVNKYRNKARFFEDRVVEKEQEAHHWKTKYDNDLSEHAASQEALIHGFNAEITNLKTQIFQFRSQLHGVKSPNNSPGGTLRTSDIKMKLFPKSPLNSPSKNLNTSRSTNSPAKDREGVRQNVNKQLQALQEELNKNCKMITELELALQLSRATIEDLERKLITETERCVRAEENLKKLEKNNDAKAENEKTGSTSETEDSNGVDLANMQSQILSKDKEMEKLQEKVCELEPLMKDYFSNTKKLSDAERKIKELEEALENSTHRKEEFENNIEALEKHITCLKESLVTKEKDYEKLEEKFEALETVNTELRSMIDRTASDLEVNKKELQIMSPKIEKMQKVSESEHIALNSLKARNAECTKEIDSLKAKLVDTQTALKGKDSALKDTQTALKGKDSALKDAVEKNNELEFQINEMKIEDQELKNQIEDYEKKIGELQLELNIKLEEVKTTGEELAVSSVDIEKYKRIIEELKANTHDLESAVADREVELCEKDKIIDEKDNEISFLKSEKRNNKTISEIETKNEQLSIENEKLKKNNEDLEKMMTVTKSDFEEKFKINNKTVSEIESKNEQLSKENEKLKQNNEDLEKMVTVTKSEFEEKCKELEEKYQSQTTEMTESQSLLKTKILELEAEIVKCQTETKENREQVVCEHEKCKELEDKLSEAQQECKSLRETCENLKNSLGEENDVMLNEALLEIAELKSTVHTHKTLHHKVKGDLEDALLTIENNRGELDRLKEQLEAKNKSESILENKMKNVQHDHDGLKEELESRRQNEEALKSKIEKYEVEVNKFNVQVESMKELEQVLEKKIEQLQTDGKLQSEEESEFNLKLQTTESELKSKHEELECAEKIVSEMKELLKRRDEQIEEIHNELRTSRKTIESLNRELENKVKQVLHLENDISAIKAKADSLESKVSKLEEELLQRDEKLQQVREEISATESCTVRTLKDQVKELEEKMEVRVQELNTQLNDRLQENESQKSVINEHKLKHEKRETYIQTLQTELDQLKKKLEDMKSEIVDRKQLKDLENELKGQLTLKEVDCETLNLEIKVLKDDLAQETKRYEKVKEKLEGIQALGGGDFNDDQKSKFNCDNTHLEKLSEIQRLYEAEKVKNEEYKKLLNDTSEMHCLSPQNSVRKLRKEKIELENSLTEAKYKISVHESKIKDLELRLANNETKNRDSIPSHDPLLQRKLNHVTGKLQDMESTNKSLVKEVSALQSLVERLESELKEERERNDVPIERDIHRRSRASFLANDPRQSISSPSTEIELTKTREREQMLRETLKEANTTMHEWLTKLSDTEKQLHRKTQELSHARDTIQQLQEKNARDGKQVDQQIQEYMSTNNELKMEIIEKDGELEIKSRTMENLERQLDLERKSRQTDKLIQEELKLSLKDQDNMLQEQEDLLNSKEAELVACQKQLNDLLSNGENKSVSVKELEKKLKEERDKHVSIVKDNNAELKAMECALTEARKEIEELKSHGADKMYDVHIEEIKREAEKSVQDLNNKNRSLQCQNKELNLKLSTLEEKKKSLAEEKHTLEQNLKHFKEERDKLVSGLEAVLKKKDAEIKQHKDVIKQLKEKEIHITKRWQEEREQVAAGLQELNEHRYPVKNEPPSPASPTSRTISSPESQSVRSPGSQSVHSPRSQTFCTPVPQAEHHTPHTEAHTVRSPVTQEVTEIQTLAQSPGSSRKGSRPPEETETSGKPKRVSSRRKKRPSSEGLENLPPLPKKKLRESDISESDDYSSHLQVDATPAVAAKTLKRTRKKNGSQVDLSKQEDAHPSDDTGKSSGNKRSAKHRLLKSFRESPMGRTSKKVLDSIAETFSPRSPTKESKSPLREDNSAGNRGVKQESLGSVEDLCEEPKKKTGRGRGRHKLYTGDSYISQPFENTGEFVQSPPEDVHQRVTRSLRSRKH